MSVATQPRCREQPRQRVSVRWLEHSTTRAVSTSYSDFRASLSVRRIESADRSSRRDAKDGAARRRAVDRMLFDCAMVSPSSTDWTRTAQNDAVSLKCFATPKTQLIASRLDLDAHVAIVVRNSALKSVRSNGENRRRSISVQTCIEWLSSNLLTDFDKKTAH
jgi:hypothetical protein